MPERITAEPDLVFRLRREADGWPGADEGRLLRAAADAIEMLRNEATRLRAVLDMKEQTCPSE